MSVFPNFLLKKDLIGKHSTVFGLIKHEVDVDYWCYILHCRSKSSLLLGKSFIQQLSTFELQPQILRDAGLTCIRCGECHDNLRFGLCIKGATTSKCFCKQGWTDANAKKVIVPNGVSDWSKNRIRADSCKIPCHYTHDFW